MTGDGALTPEGAAELLRSGAAQAVDVREQEEWDAGHIGGARHLELAQLAGRAEELDRESPVLVYCRSGERSGMAAEALRASGWEAFTLDGGLVAWVEQGLPLEPEDGSVAPRRTLPGELL
jgi:rhodanese-related sulfurtransferase